MNCSKDVGYFWMSKYKEMRPKAHHHDLSNLCIDPNMECERLYDIYLSQIPSE